MSNTIHKNNPAEHARSLLLALLAVTAAWVPVYGDESTAIEATASLAPPALESTPRHYQVSRMVTRFAERAHYSQARINNDLSEIILNNYIDALDSNKSYMIRSDIEYFQRYRFKMDDALRSGEMDAIFDIFRIYRLRARERLEFAGEQLKVEPDFALDEQYVFDRKDVPWAADEKEMQDLWRKRVKNDALSLMLAEKDWEESAEILGKRYQQVLKRINRLDADDVFEIFMNTFANTLDPHSSYMSPSQSEEYRIQMSLSYQGVGASLQLEDEFVTVLNVIPGGPAAIDGRMQANDRITAVGQDEAGELVDVVGWMLDDVVQLIRGKSGTVVRLQITPGDTASRTVPYILALTRDKIKLEEQAAQSSIIEIERDDQPFRLGVIEVPSFYQDFDARSRGDDDYVSTTRDVRRLIGELEEQSIDGLIMDLRGNGGGHLSEATALSGLFIEQGPVVQLKDTNQRIEVLDDPIPSVAYTGPLVVMVNRFSASASEIFAAVIQDYNRGIIVGQQTFGKGTVQNLYVLDQYARRPQEPGLGQLTLTIGKYYRVTGESTQHRGVIPDIELPSTIDATTIGESTRPRALAWDQIKSAKYRSRKPLTDEINTLTVDHLNRATRDPDMEFLVEDIKAIEYIRARNFISLNLEARKTEQEENKQASLNRENLRREANDLEPIQSVSEFSAEDRPDILLQEAAEILTDLAFLDDIGGAVLSQTLAH
ncbi:MAG: carboxy terminal-processing peptidase [Gammaproteobacteria bacterium]